jgi:hypothetical protein
MAQDPYGFSESSAPVSSTAASQAMWFGIAGSMLASVGICACYAPYFAAAPLGLYGAYQGYVALQVAQDPRERNMATAGVVSGLLSGLVSSLFVMFIVAYVGFLCLYMLFMFLVIGAGAAGNF